MRINQTTAEAIINAIAVYLKPFIPMNANTITSIYGFGINYCQEFKWSQMTNSYTEFQATIPDVGEISINESLINELESQISSDLIETISEKALLKVYPQFSPIIHSKNYKFMVDRLEDLQIKYN